MPHGQGEIADKRELRLLQAGPFDQKAPQGIRPVEDIYGDISFGCRLHHIGERGDVGIKSRANVLDVEYQGVETFEHLRGGPSGFAIKAIDGQARRSVL